MGRAMTQSPIRPIGLLGGTTPEATKVYYQTIIDLGRDVLAGPLNNPVVIIYSINLSEVVALQQAGQTNQVVALMVDVFERLRRAGAEVGALTAKPYRANQAKAASLANQLNKNYKRQERLRVFLMKN